MSIILNRLKKSWENDCPEKICSCGNCQENNNEPEFVLKENLSDEEIEEIIEKEYKDKNERTKHFIRRGLKKFGNKFTYHKTDIPDGSKLIDVKVIVTCHSHGDFEIIAYYFVGKLYKGCYECIHGKPLVRGMELDEFEKRLKTSHPQYSIIPGVSEYKTDRTPIKLHCDKHNLDFSSKPTNIYRHDGCPECRKEVRNKIGTEMHKEAEISLINRIEEKFPGGFDFSEVDYKNHRCSLKIKCNTCGEVIERSVLIWNRRLKNREVLCPECEKEPKRLKRMEKFKSKVEERFPGHFDLSNVNFITYHVPATGFKCLRCGKEFDVPYPDNFLTGAGCPHCDFSIGESYIRNWIMNNTESYISYEEHLNIDNSLIVGRHDDWGVEIDFVIHTDDNMTYWIEYNGEQHYNWCEHFHHTKEDFDNQLRRDQNVRNYCSDNNIVLIEIPWKYDKQEKVDEILNDIILNKKLPSDIITFPPINYYRTKKDREEAIKDGRL